MHVNQSINQKNIQRVQNNKCYCEVHGDVVIRVGHQGMIPEIDTSSVVDETVSEGDDWISDGRVFHRVDAVTGNDRRPMDSSRYAGMSSWCDDECRLRVRRPGRSATRTSWSRYGGARPCSTRTPWRQSWNRPVVVHACSQWRTVVCVASACLLVVIQWEAWVRGVQQLSNQGLSEYKGNMGSCPQVLHVSFSCFSRVLLSIRPQR